MLEIQVSDAEKAAGKLNPENQAAAVRAVKEDGFVVLADLIPLSIIEALREKMLADVAAILARDDRPFNWNPGNLQQNPPNVPPYLHREILVNDIVIGVTKAILGAGLKNAFYSGNTALPSEHRQPVHADIGQLWQGLEHPHPAYGLVVNVPVVDMDERNGSTEIWPGTHLDPAVAIQDGMIEVTDEQLARQRAIAPPIQPAVKAGSVLIRDIRMWHAGMPNRTETPRPMIAMIHYVSWWPTGDDLHFPKGTEAIFEHPDLYTCATFTEAAEDHILASSGYKS